MREWTANDLQPFLLGPVNPVLPGCTMPRPGRTGPEPSWIGGRFADDVWVSRDVNIATNANTRIEFQRMAGEFRGHAKLLLWLTEYAVDFPKRGARRITSPARFKSTFENLLTITTWLREHGLHRYEEMSEEHFADFIEEWMVRPRLRSGRGPSQPEYSHFLSTCRRLHRMGPKKLKYLPDGLAFDPDEVAQSIGVRCLVVPSTRTPEIPEQSARRMFASAIQWLEKVAPATIALVRFERAAKLLGRGLRWEEAQRIRTGYLLSGDRRPRLERLLQVLPFQVRTLLRVKTEETAGRQEDLSFLARRLTPILAGIKRMLAAAAYYVMGILSGFRVKELISVTRDGLSKRSHGWIVKSSVFKTAEDRSGYDTERPVPNGFAMAHGVLRRLAKAVGITDEGGRVFIGARHKPLNSNSIGSSIARFARLNGIDWHFSTHQLRKYFALFYVRRFRGPLDALRWHFRHVDSSMIMAYVGDAWGAKFLAEAEAALMEEVLTSIVHGRAGHTAGGIPEEEARYAATNLPLEEAERLAEAARGDHRALLAMEWGYCLRQPGNSDGTTACAASNPRERDQRRCPDVCGACPFLAVGLENKERWEQTRLLHRTVVASKLSLPLAKQASTRMVEVATGILSSLGRTAVGDVGAEV